MSYLMCNLPTRTGGHRLHGRPVGDGYEIGSSESARVCEIDETTPQGRADKIARLLEEARNQGFEQGRASVRNALGIS